MRRIWSIAVVMGLLLCGSQSVPNGQTATAAVAPPMGDVNADGVVDAVDLTLAKRYLLQSDSQRSAAKWGSDNKAGMDTSENQMVSPEDLQYFTRALCGRSVERQQIGYYDPMYDKAAEGCFDCALEELFTVNGTTYSLSSQRSTLCMLALTGRTEPVSLRDALAQQLVTPEQLLALDGFLCYYETVDGQGGFLHRASQAILEAQGGWWYGQCYLEDAENG